MTAPPQQMIVNTVDKNTITKTYALRRHSHHANAELSMGRGSSYYISRLTDFHIVNYKEIMYTTAF